MTSRKTWVPKGIYGNRQTNRRERYDGGGNVVESQGYQYANNHPGHYGKFGKLPDVPACPFDYVESYD